MTKSKKIDSYTKALLHQSLLQKKTREESTLLRRFTLRLDDAQTEHLDAYCSRSYLERTQLIRMLIDIFLKNPRRFLEE